MDSFNWFVLDYLYSQEVRERELAWQTLQEEARKQQQGRSVKHALASLLVRVGLRLDPAAGEGLRAPALSMTRPEAGQRA